MSEPVENFAESREDKIRRYAKNAYEIRTKNGGWRWSWDAESDWKLAERLVDTGRID